MTTFKILSREDLYPVDRRTTYHSQVASSLSPLTACTTPALRYRHRRTQGPTLLEEGPSRWASRRWPSQHQRHPQIAKVTNSVLRLLRESQSLLGLRTLEVQQDREHGLAYFGDADELPARRSEGNQSRASRMSAHMSSRMSSSMSWKKIQVVLKLTSRAWWTMLSITTQYSVRSPQEGKSFFLRPRQMDVQARYIHTVYASSNMKARTVSAKRSRPICLPQLFSTYSSFTSFLFSYKFQRTCQNVSGLLSEPRREWEKGTSHN